MKKTRYAPSVPISHKKARTIATCRLYLITPPEIDLDRFAPELIQALDTGEVAAVQLRLPDADEATLRRAVEKLQPIARSRDVAFLLSEAVELAAELGSDGVHLAKGADYAAARKRLGAKASIGVSCYDSRHLGMDAAEAGADYVSFGAFFESQSVTVTNTASIETLEWWSEIMTTPAVAIGGITAANCAPLVAAGADFLAVIQAVWAHGEGAAAGVKALAQAIDEAESSLSSD